MAWIESHQALGQHPKTLALAAALNCTLPTAVGHLQYLWWWALDYAQDGLVTSRTRSVIARACQWRGQPDRFWSALVEAGFVDELDHTGTGRIHDWSEYGGKYFDQRARTAERKRRARAASGGQTPDVHRMSGNGEPGRPEPPTPDVRPYRRGEERRGQESTGQDRTVTPDSELNPAGPARQPRAYARETAESPELLAEHLMRIEQERASQAKPSQPSENLSQDDDGR